MRELAPWLRVPPIVVELCAGIAIGPFGFDLIHLDEPIQVFSQIGLAALLYLAGREIRLKRLRGRVLELALAGFGASLVLAFAVSELLRAAGVIHETLLVAIVLASTSLSVLIVPLKDAGQTATRFGQLVIAAASLAEMGAIVLLSFFFSGKHAGVSTELLHLGLFAVLAAALYATMSGGRSWERLSAAFDRLAETTSQIRVRADFALVAVAVGLASELGQEAILAAFTVGVLRGIGEQEDRHTGPDRVEIVAFGIFIPFFFVKSGLQFDVDALFGSVTSALRLPVFFVALLVVRGLPALLYRGYLGAREAVAAGFLQATSLSFVVVAAQIGVQVHALNTASAAAFIGAGLLSVVFFPAVGLGLVRDR
ncbi:MAG: cation:proton antiporter [Actinomycetota bacterium]|nr:cation:proton antiporter [Actinomycetota bacterium]